MAEEIFSKSHAGNPSSPIKPFLVPLDHVSTLPSHARVTRLQALILFFSLAPRFLLVSPPLILFLSLAPPPLSRPTSNLVPHFHVLPRSSAVLITGTSILSPPSPLASSFSPSPSPLPLIHSPPFSFFFSSSYFLHLPQIEANELVAVVYRQISMTFVTYVLMTPVGTRQTPPSYPNPPSSILAVRMELSYKGSPGDSLSPQIWTTQVTQVTAVTSNLDDIWHRASFKGSPGDSLSPQNLGDTFFFIFLEPPLRAAQFQAVLCRRDQVTACHLCHLAFKQDFWRRQLFN